MDVVIQVAVFSDVGEVGVSVMLAASETGCLLRLMFGSRYDLLLSECMPDYS